MRIMRLAKVVSGEEHDRKLNIGIVRELLDHGTTGIWFFMQDDWLQVELFKETGHRLLDAMVVPMNHEDFV